jgi:DNA primase
MAFDQQIIDEIGSLTDIGQLVGSYIPLKKSGANFTALCPFHKEKSPSFMVSPQKQIFHCFGCGEGGNIFSFVMKIEGLTFPEAVRLLAEKCNVQIPEKKFQSQESRDAKTRSFEILERTTRFYENLLWDEKRGASAREYLKKRGITQETARAFRLGWALDDWRGLIESVVKANFRVEELEALGLAVINGDKRYDMFRARLMFPIFDSQGKPIGFGGRVIGQGEPKYLNSPETVVYKKRRELYNLNQSKHAIQEAKTALVVEGYLDLISLWQAGIHNVVATLGTALTVEHVRVLKRYAESVVMVYDGDSAGVNAALRSLDVFLEEEMPVRVMILPEGMDPDDTVQKEGKEAFLNRVFNAEDIFDFKWHIFEKRYSVKDSAGMARLSSEMLDLILKVKNNVVRDRYVADLASRLGVRDEAIRQEILKVEKQKNKFVTNEKEEPKVVQKNNLFPEEKLLLSCVLQNTDLLEEALTHISPELFQEEVLRSLWIQLKQFAAEVQNEKHFPVERFVRWIQSPLYLQCLSDLLSMEGSPDGRRMFEDCLRRMKQRALTKQMEQLRLQIKQAEAQKDEAKLHEHLNALQALVTKGN